MTDTLGFTNEGRTTVNMGGGTGTGTTITFAAGAPTLPAAGLAFDVRIENEWIRIPAASNGGGPTYASVLRGQYSSSNANHANGTPVTEVVTAADLSQFVQTVQEALAADTDVLIATPLNDDVLTYETSSGKWKNKPVTSGSTSLAGDSDVVLSSPANNDVLTYETSSGKWKNKPLSPASDATTSTVGVVLVDHAPSGSHPVALTTDSVAMPSGLLGTSSTKAAAGNDGRLSDARTALAHETSHLPNGSDAIDWAGTIHRAGTHAGRPAAGVTNAGCEYFETDTGNLFRSDGSVWLQIAISSGGGGATALSGLTDVAITSIAKGDVLVYDSTGAAWKNYAAGTAGYVLTSNGAAALPTWQAATGGSGMTLLASTSPSAASSTSFSSISGAYTHLKLLGVLKMSASDILVLDNVNGDTGNNYTWSGFDNQGGTTAGRGGNSTSFIEIATENGNGCFINLDIDIQLYADTTNGGGVMCQFVASDSKANTPRTGYSHGRWFPSVAAAINAFRIRPGTGTITGVLDLYGI